MKNKKEFFGILIGVLFSVFLVFLFVYATTTVGEDITVGDDLVVDGLASISEDLRVPTIYGNTDAGLYLRIGDQALTSHNFDAQDDLLITGDLEVDGTAFFDGAVSVSSNGLLLDGGAAITTGVTSPSGACVVGSLYINTAGGVGAVLHICDETDAWTLINAD